MIRRLIEAAIKLARPKPPPSMGIVMRRVLALRPDGWRTVRRHLGRRIAPHDLYVLPTNRRRLFKAEAVVGGWDQIQPVLAVVKSANSPAVCGVYSYGVLCPGPSPEFPTTYMWYITDRLDRLRRKERNQLYWQMERLNQCSRKSRPWPEILAELPDNIQIVNFAERLYRFPLVHPRITLRRVMRDRHGQFRLTNPHLFQIP